MRKLIGLACLCVWFASCNQNTNLDGENTQVSESNSPEVKATTVVRNNGLLGTWKVVGYKDSLPGINDELKTEGREVALSSTYTLINDTSYSILSKNTPEGDDGKWGLQVQGADTLISFASNQEKYKGTYQLNYLGNRLEFTKEIPNVGFFRMILIRQ